MTKSQTNWTGAEILQKVCELAAEQVDLPAEKVKADSRLIEDLNFDSLTEIELVMKLEDTFEINLPDDERQPGAAIPKTLREFAHIVEAKLGDETGSGQ